MHEWARHTQRMNAPEHTPEAEQRVEIIEIGRMPALARIERKTKTGELTQGFFLFIAQGRDDGDFQLQQGAGKVVLFLNLCVAPAFGAVELGDQRTLTFYADLINPVFVSPLTHQDMYTPNLLLVIIFVLKGSIHMYT